MRRWLGVALGLLTAALTAGALIQVRRLSVLGERAGANAFYFALAAPLVVAGAVVASGGALRRSRPA